MELTMELDDFKNAWQTLDRRLQQQNALNFQLLRSHRVDAMRRGFRPLVIGQAIGMLVGVAAMLALLPLWTHAAPTHDLAVKICGIGLHAYCVALIVFGGIMQGFVAGIDYAAPVLAIQQRLLKMRRFYIVGGMLLGLPWWFLAAPLLVVLTRGAILDQAPATGPAGWEAALRHWVEARLAEGATDLRREANAVLERVLIDAALAAHGGHRQNAARALGVGRNTMTRKLGSSRRRSR